MNQGGFSMQSSEEKNRQKALELIELWMKELDEEMSKEDETLTHDDIHIS
jgi:hypothetical protein